jgi:hypothetical protein
MGCERPPWNILQCCSSTGKPVAKPDAAGPWWVPLLEVGHRSSLTRDPCTVLQCVIAGVGAALSCS